MIVMDMDGTLLNNKKLIDDKTKGALMKVQKMGVCLVLASGRPTQSLLKYAYELQMDQYDGYLISYNGAVIYSMAKNKVLRQAYIPKKEAQQILKHLENFDAIKMIQDETYLYVHDVFQTIEVDGKQVNIIEYEARSGQYRLCEKESLADLSFDCPKILVAQSPSKLQKDFLAMSKPFENKVQMLFTAPFYYEFTNIDANKGLSLRKLTSSLSIDLGDVLGFGDDLNDLPFLEIVGHPYAMQNANPRLIEKIDQTCASNEEAGIAHTLAHYFTIEL